MSEGASRNHPCPCGSGRKYKKCCLGKPPFPLKKGKEITESDRETIAAIIDDTIDKHVADPGVVFGPEPERHKHRSRAIDTKRADWVNPRDCMYLGCTKLSIKRSHTIPRSALELIAEDSHVMHPRVNPWTAQLEVTQIGINQASTFAGYCHSHEQEFQCFESSLKMQQDSHILLQLFRTICREIAIKEHQLRVFQPILARYAEKRADWVRERMEEAIRARYLVDAKWSIGDCEIKVADVHAEAVRRLNVVSTQLDSFKKHFFEPFVESQETGIFSLPLLRHNLPKRLPVALAGQGNICVRKDEDSNEHNTPAVINVLPLTKGTEIFICVPQDRKPELQSYIYHRIGNLPDESAILRMVEAWMLHGSDHWFLSPKAWAALSNSQRSAVLAAIENLSFNIGADPQVSILDLVRKDAGGSP